jgi:hypothetical protein
LFRKFPLRKKREQKSQIKIKYQTKYVRVPSKKYNSKKLIDCLRKTITNIFRWKILVTIDIIKYKYREVLSPEDIDALAQIHIPNYFNKFQRGYFSK